MPADAGLANQPMASATSTGWPPWLMEFMRRPASRMAKGMAAVMAVSMKPGATALMVMPFFAKIGALACTMPTTPALETA